MRLLIFLLLTSVAMGQPWTLHDHRYEGLEWDCYAQPGSVRYEKGGKVIKRYRLTASQSERIRQAIVANRFFELPARRIHERQDDSDVLSISLHGRKHTFTFNGNDTPARQRGQAILKAVARVAPLPLRELGRP